ncbi:MAG: type II secretion system GspH family protein [Sulfurimonas sp.]|nr:type II secretion system GspH family protein [Sulfurimonas sp.]
MKHKKNAFTMIELIFVIVILGTLAAVAVPKFTGMKNTSELAKAKSNVAAIRSAIMTERQRSLVRGTATYIPQLTPSTASVVLFTGDGNRTLLSNGIRRGTDAGDWNIISTASDEVYEFNSGTRITAFIYESVDGNFTCVPATTNDCDALTN